MGRHSSHKSTRKFRRLREAAADRQNWKCHWCKCNMTDPQIRKPTAMSGDLVIPVSEGGKIVEWNVVAACRYCNGSRANWDYKEVSGEQKMKVDGWDLDFFQTGDWQAADERLKDLTKKKISWCPGRTNLFRALQSVPFDSVKVMILGQDPYPNPKWATGLAFSIPATEVGIPVTLSNIILELNSDVQVYPTNGDLSEWAQEGVLLWNTLPTCLLGKSKSHNWPEWHLLTGEIIRKLSYEGIVFVFMGKWAEHFRQFVHEPATNRILVTSHPSPRGNTIARTKSRTAQAFLGSRIFSRINQALAELGEEPVDWSTQWST